MCEGSSKLFFFFFVFLKKKKKKGTGRPLFWKYFWIFLLRCPFFFFGLQHMSLLLVLLLLFLLPAWGQGRRYFSWCLFVQKNLGGHLWDFSRVAKVDFWVVSEDFLFLLPLACPSVSVLILPSISRLASLMDLSPFFRVVPIVCKACPQRQPSSTDLLKLWCQGFPRTPPLQADE